MDLLAGETGLCMGESEISEGGQVPVGKPTAISIGGLKGEEIGNLSMIGASAVSQERNKLTTRIAEDEAMKIQFEAVSSKCLT